MSRPAAALLALSILAGPASASEEIVSAPRPGEQETAQAGGGVGRYSFVGALRCPDAAAIVGVTVAEGPLLNFVQLGCAPVVCAHGACAWRPEALRWGPAAGARTGRSSARLCPPTAVVTGFRADVLPVRGGSAIRLLAIQCGPISGLSLSGEVAVGTAADPRTTRTVVPAIRDTGAIVPGTCRDRGISAISLAVGAYPAGAGGQGEHVRALSMFCPGAAVERGG